MIRLLLSLVATLTVACASNRIATKPGHMRIGAMLNVQYGETIHDRPGRADNYTLWTDLNDGIIYEWFNGAWRMHGYLSFGQSWPRPDFYDTSIPTMEVNVDGDKCWIER